jgi:hypothetical protein
LRCAKPIQVGSVKRSNPTGISGISKVNVNVAPTIAGDRLQRAVREDGRAVGSPLRCEQIELSEIGQKASDRSQRTYSLFLPCRLVVRGELDQHTATFTIYGNQLDSLRAIHIVLRSA